MDLKKVIAYSTCSQMGYLVFCVGLAKFDLSLFHLVNHAFFKCLLFVGAGAVIHSFFNEQDIRRFGGLFKLLPYIWTLFFFASMSLMGLPFLSGFYSKEKILEYAFYTYNKNNLFVFWLGNLSALFTSIYSIRLISYTFFNKPNNYKKHYEHFHGNLPWILNFVLFCLGLGTLFSGFFLEDLMIGASTDWSNYTLYSIKNYAIDIHMGNFHLNFLTFKYTIFGFFLYFFYHLYYQIFSFQKIFILLGSFFSFWPKELLSKTEFQRSDNVVKFKASKNIKSMFVFFNDLDTVKENKLFQILYFFFSKKWFINYFYNSLLTKSIFFVGYYFTFKTLDKGYFEFVSFFGFVRFFAYYSNLIYYRVMKFSHLEEILSLIFLSFIFFYVFIFSNILISFFYSYFFLSIFFFAVPKKKISKKTILKRVKLKLFSRKFFFLSFGKKF